MGCSGSSLVYACYHGDWEKAKKLIIKHPHWCSSAETCCSGVHGSPAHYMVLHDNVEMLQFMYDTLVARPDISLCSFRLAFDRGDTYHPTPMVWAIENEKTNCIKWLAEHVYDRGQIFKTQSSVSERFKTYAHLAAHHRRMLALDLIVQNVGGTALEVRDFEQNTPAHLSDCTPATLEYFVRHAPSGTGILFMRNAWGQTPIDIADRYGRGGSVYFTPQKIAELNAELRERLVRSEKRVELPPPYPEKRADSSPAIC